MLRYGEFDISEMSLSWYTRSIFTDPRPFIAIPIFPSRMFRHGCIYVNSRSGIVEPKDLIGKRIGCPEYQMTAAVWLRGILADLYEVPIDSVTYCTGGLRQPGRTETRLDLPQNLRVEAIPHDRTLSEMIELGEIDALYTAEMPEPFKVGSPNVKRLFEEYASEEKHYYAQTGIFPIMHVIVIRRDVYEANPWIAQSVTKAFVSAQQIAYGELYETTALKLMLPWLMDHTEESRRLLGQDFWPYGIDRNRHVLSTFLRYSHEQGLTPRQLEPDELFASETLITAKT